MADQGWLFRDGDLILGPVSAQQIIDKLYAGELQPQSEVQALGSGRFLKVAEVPEFKVHVAKAEAKMRIDAQASQHHAEVKQTRNRALIIGAGVLVVLGIIVAVIGNYLAVHGSGGKTAEELAWGDITVDAPTVSKAKRREDDELVDYQGSGKKVPTALAVKQPNTGQPKQPQNTGKPSMGNSDPDGMSLGEVDEAGINAVVAKNKATLIGCIKQVAKPGVYMKIPIEFSIAEAGKVSKVWVDNSDLKDSGLNDCLLKELQKWPFKPGHSGNSVNLSFNVGKKS